MKKSKKAKKLLEIIKQDKVSRRNHSQSTIYCELNPIMVALLGKGHHVIYLISGKQLKILL